MTKMIMEQETGVYEIINNEGAICKVDTKTKGKPTFGPIWESICNSYKSSTLLEAIIDRPQYRFRKVESPEDIPTGLVVKIGGEVEAFLPGSLSSKEYSSKIIGERIAVMIESFDPLSRSIVVREIAYLILDLIFLI